MQVFNEGRGTGWQHIYFIVEYETVRDETKLGIRYRIKWQLDKNYYYGYNLVADVWAEGTNFGRQIKANMPNRGSGEALFPENGDYYWFEKGYSSNKINGCRVVIKTTNGGTVKLDSGEDKTVTTPVGYKVSEISNNIDFIVGNNIPITINDITNQNYNYKLTLQVLNDNNNWIDIKTLDTTSKSFTLDLSDETNTIYSNIITKNSAKIKILLQTFINNTSLGYTVKEGTCYVKDSNPTPIDFMITSWLNDDEEIEELTAGYGIYNQSSNIKVKINKIESNAAKNGATLKKIIISAGRDSSDIGIANIVGTDVYEELFIDPFSTIKDNELVDGKAPVTVTVVDSRGNTATTQKQLKIDKYIPAYFTELELKRTNNIDEEVRLIAKGKCQSAGVWLPTITYFLGHDYDTEGIIEPNYIDESYIEYNSETEEFTVNAPIQGDLGAVGFTKEQEFPLTIGIEDHFNQNYPRYYKLYVRKGQVLLHYGKNGVAFGALYDTEEGGSLQVDGKDILKKNILLDSTIERIITGILTPAFGVNVSASTYVAVGKIIIIGLDLTAKEQISQYQSIAYFNNGGLSGNGYIYTTANETCFLNKNKQSIDIYKSGGLAAGEKVYINAVAILNS